MGAVTDSVKGFGVTFAHMFRKVYHEVPVRAPGLRAALPRPAHPQPSPGRAGEVHRLRVVRLGLPRRRHLRRGGDNTDEARFSPGERYAAVYQINYARCIFCGLCIEACPTRSLTMSNEYELARDSRQDLIFTKEQLLAPLLPGMERPPHPMWLGDSEKDYYLGALTNPGTSAGAERPTAGTGAGRARCRMRSTLALASPPM